MTAHFYDAVRLSPFYRPEHEAFRATLRRFVAARNRALRQRNGTRPASSRASFMRRPPRSAIIGLGFPEQYGGSRMRPLHAHHGDAGVRALRLRRRRRRPVQPHDRRAADPAARLGGDEGARAAADSVGRENLGARDHRTLAAAPTSPICGPRARRDGDHYVVNGSKTFITSGMRADFITLAVRTGGPGAGGVSLILIEGDPPGLQRTPLKKMGWWCSDTATLYFENVPRARRQPDRQGRRGLSRHHAEFQRRAPARRGGRDRLRAGLSGGGDRLCARSARPSASR